MRGLRRKPRGTGSVEGEKDPGVPLNEPNIDMAQTFSTYRTSTL